jgi:hypothetical protein
MLRKSTGRTLRHEVSSGEILVGFVWVVLYVELMAFDRARDVFAVLAERVPSALF